MPKKVRKWKVEFELWDNGLPDKFGDSEYIHNECIERVIKENWDNGIKCYNFKIRRVKKKRNE